MGEKWLPALDKIKIIFNLKGFILFGLIGECLLKMIEKLRILFGWMGYGQE